MKDELDPLLYPDPTEIIQKDGGYEGQGFLEYALVLILVAMIVVIVLALLGPAIGNLYSNIMNLI